MNHKVISESDFLRQLADIRKTHPSLVFTNGCFDILHAGHVTYLDGARALGDCLVVGLNSDRSVRGYKGPSRPINCFEDRATVLSGLSAVDYILEMDDATPVRLIQAIQPDIHVKGGDYEKTALPEYKTVESYGGRVEILPFLPGRSTTEILKKAETL